MEYLGELEAPEEGGDAVVTEGDRRRLVWLMAEYFRTVGFSDIKARIPGFTPPEVLSGTLEDHRPDLTCRQSDSGHTPIVLEGVTPEGMARPGVESRWSLLASAARLYRAELHFVVPKWSASGGLEGPLRRRLAGMAVIPNRIWAV